MDTPGPGRILDQALEMADHTGWEPLRLHQVADAMGITLNDIRRHYREKEDLAEAWFDRADAAMLAAAGRPETKAMPGADRLEYLIMAWLEALAPHQRVTRQMILNKLEPGHLHVQIPAVLRISHTVQWIREAAGCEASYLRRAMEEVALTSIYLATFCTWLRDDSPGFERTRHRLQRLLARTGRISPFRCGGPPDGRPQPASPPSADQHDIPA